MLLEGREVHADVGGRCGDDGGEVLRLLLERHPLVEARVRSAPHRDLAVRPGLGGQPLHHVVAVPRVLEERLEAPLGVAAPAHVHDGEDIAVAGEVVRPLVVGVADVGGQLEDDGERRSPARGADRRWRGASPRRAWGSSRPTAGRRCSPSPSRRRERGGRRRPEATPGRVGRRANVMGGSSERRSV